MGSQLFVHSLVMRLAAVVATVMAVVVDALPGGGCGDPKAGPVLRGIDLVALYNDPTKAPINGTDEFSDDALGGYVFRFATQANLDAFRANRSKYTPGYGGY